MTQQELITNEVLKLLSDNKPHSISEIHTLIEKRGLDLKSDSTLVRTVLCLMTKENKIQRVQRGIYKSVKATPSTSEYITLLPSSNRQTNLSINILENSHINLNGKLNAEIKTRNITIQFNYNYKQLRLIPNGEHSHKFTKAGTAKNSAICNELRRHRISFPAHYEVKYNPNTLTYDGILSSNTK